jgi:hypothetical protein
MITTRPCRLSALLLETRVMLDCNTVLGTGGFKYKQHKPLPYILTGDAVGRYFILANHSTQHGSGELPSTSIVDVTFSINDTSLRLIPTFICQMHVLQQETVAA